MTGPVTKAEGSFAATGQSAEVEVRGKANIFIDGGDGTVVIERKMFGQSAFTAISKDSSGNPASYATATLGFNGTIEDPEPGALYRLNCTVFVSGPISFRISQ